MKRLFLIASLLLGFANSQIHSEVTGGIKVDGNLSNFILSDPYSENASSKFGMGFSAGGFAKFEFFNKIALQPELLLQFRNSTIKQKTPIDNKDPDIIYIPEIDYQYFGVEVPLYAMYQSNLESGSKVIFGVGPYLGFGITAKQKLNIENGNVMEVDLYQEFNGQKSNMQRFDFGVGVNVAYEFNFMPIQVGLTWKLGLTNVVNHSDDIYSMKNHSFSLGLGYRFKSK